MIIDIILIDLLGPNGVLDTYKIRPKGDAVDLTIDRYSDVLPERFSDDDLDIGGTRLYNATHSSIERIRSRLKSFTQRGDNFFSFQFEHMGIPLGPSQQGVSGIYNLVLPSEWRCSELYISDPYDKQHDEIKKKKQFQHSVIWDPKCSTQLIEMQLRSRRGSFSFIVTGSASHIGGPPPATPYVASEERYGAVSQIPFELPPDPKITRQDADELAGGFKYIDLKPNFFGLGINFNKIIKDVIYRFKKKAR